MITIIYPKALGGVHTYVQNLSLYLNSRSIYFKIISYREKKQFGTCFTMEKKRYGNYITISFSKYATRISNYEAIRRHISADDFLICNDSLELDAINYYHLNNYTVSVFHGDLDHYYKLTAKYESILDSVFCVSEGLVNINKKKFPGLDFRLSYPLVQNSTRRTEINRSGNIRILYVSRISYDKGADVLFKVIEASRKHDIPLHWKILCPTDGSEQVLLDKLPGEIDIEFDLPNETVLSRMLKADMLFFPSRTEGFGMVVLEAMKKGVVVIANNLPYGIPDMVSHKKNGFLVDISRVDDICMLLHYCISNRAVLAGMSDNAINSSHQKFDFERTGNNFLQHITEIRGKVKPKIFVEQQFSIKERLLPEFFYRSFKWALG